MTSEWIGVDEATREFVLRHLKGTAEGLDTSARVNGRHKAAADREDWIANMRKCSEGLKAAARFLASARIRLEFEETGKGSAGSGDG